jgi:hypothetical protein
VKPEKVSSPYRQENSEIRAIGGRSRKSWRTGKGRYNEGLYGRSLLRPEPSRAERMNDYLRNAFTEILAAVTEPGMLKNFQ